MSYLICGLGQAGGKIVDEMFAHETFRRLATPFAINSTAKDLSLLHNIPRPNWVGVSEDKGLVEGTVENFEGRVVGGFGKNPQKAHEVMKKNYDKILEFFTDYAWKQAIQDEAEPNDMGTTSASGFGGTGSGDDWEEMDEGEEDSWEEALESIPFALLVVGLGGGTGCGIAGTIAKAIRESSSVDTTILVVGVLPATFDETKNRTGTGRQAWNTMFALRNVEPHVDGIIVVDNECLAHTGTPENHFNEYNRFVANALVELFSVHLLEEIDLGRIQGAALPLVDIQDIRSAMSLPKGKNGSKPGYASLGWAAAMARSPGAFVLGRKKFDLDIEDLQAASVRKQTVARIDLEKASKTLGLLRVPLHMVRKPQLYPDTTSIEADLASRSSMDEVHFGITVTRRSLASLITLHTFEKKQIARLASLQAMASAYTKKKGES